jgi:flagellum-specific ATP synthase
MLATYREAEDLINIGAYASGSNPAIDEAIRMIGPIREYLKQDIREHTQLDESIERLLALTR